MVKFKVWIIPVLLLGIFITACQSSEEVIANSTPTDEAGENITGVVNTHIAPLATETIMPKLTMTPTFTPIPTVTATLIPTLDANLSALLGVGSTSRGSFVVIQLPDSSRSYRVDIDGNVYECEKVTGYSGRLYCEGEKIPEATPFTIHVIDNNLNAVVLVLESKGYVAATQSSGNPDWICEVEPLWVAPLTGPYGCYAATCYSRTTGERVAGTQNSCTTPFPYWLYQTPAP